MGPWWLRHFRRDILAGLGILSVLAGFALLFSWMHSPRPEQDRPIEGRVVGFHGVLVKSQFRNLVLISVRLPDGRIANVPMPRSGRAAHCRQGDRIRLVRNGARLRVDGAGCDRR